jgi:hypothetical protein
MAKMFGQNIICSTYCISKTTLCLGNTSNAVDHVCEGVYNSIDRQIISVAAIFPRSLSSVHFAVELQVMYNIFPFREDLVEKR